MGDEGPRRRAAVQRLHHGGFHFDEAARFQLPPQRGDNARAPNEDVAHGGIGDQIQIALAIANLHVLQAVPLFGHGEQGLGQEFDLFDVDAELAGAGAEQVAFDADDVADIEHFEKLEIALADGVFLDVKLQALTVLLEMREAGLSHVADRHHAAGNPHLDARGQLIGGPGAVLAQNVRNAVGGIEALAVGPVAQGFDLARTRRPLFQ